MEPEEEKKLNDDFIDFVRKRSETEAPRYVTKLKRLADVHAKKRRAALARKRAEQRGATENVGMKKSECAVCGKTKIGDQTIAENDSRKIIRRGGEQSVRSGSRSRSGEPVDRCGRRRRRRRRSCGRRRRRRRRSCCCKRRRKRRRRSCSRRRRRRSCSRRRRRRSCRRRRRRQRRRRC